MTEKKEPSVERNGSMPHPERPATPDRSFRELQEQLGRQLQETLDSRGGQTVRTLVRRVNRRSHVKSR